MYSNIDVAQHRLLSNIDLSDCNQVTDASVSAIAGNCPELQTINLFDCKEITDTDVVAVADNSSQLGCIDISACCQITETAKSCNISYLKCINLGPAAI